MKFHFIIDYTRPKKDEKKSSENGKTKDERIGLER